MGPTNFGGNQGFGAGLMNFLGLGQPQTTNQNPYTNFSMQGLTNSANFMQQGLGGAYGNMGAGISGALNAYNPQNFMNQFMAQAPGLNQVAANSQTGQNALMGQAQQVGNMGVQNVANQFAGLGSLYSGGAGLAANTAMINPMMQALSQGSQQQSSLLGNMYNQGLYGLNQGNISQMQGGLQGAGLYGQQGSAMTNAYSQLSDLLGGYGSPMMMNQPSGLSQIGGMLGNIGQGVGSLFGGGAAGGTAAGGGLGGLLQMFGL
jgi:hypothetical protein